nr:TfoX/Sxy family protein [Propionicimonas sp.]
MAYDHELAGRIRAALSFHPGIAEKRMFGGLAFLVDGHMVAAASNEGMMLRVDPAGSARLLDGERVRPVRMNGRDLGGWLYLEPEVIEDESSLRAWLDRGLARVRTLPPKPAQS